MTGSKKCKGKQDYKADYGEATPEQVALALLTYRREPKPVDSVVESTDKRSPRKGEFSD